MAFKSHLQPLCRCCGKPIAKRVSTCYVSEKSTLMINSSFSRTLVVDAPLVSKEDCERHSNQIVTSLSYHRKSDDGPRSVFYFNEWDGESYKDEFFCTGNCAQQFARMMARNYPTKGTVAWADAITRQRGEEPK